MTAYITQQDLTERIGEDELTVLSDREGTGEINTAVVDRAIADATNEINMHLSSRYLMPLPEVPDTIKRLAVSLTIYWLSETDTTMSDMVERALPQCRQNAKGSGRWFHASWFAGSG